MGLLTREKEEKGREGERKRRKRERKKKNTFMEKTFGGEGGKRATFHWIVDRVTSVKEES